MENGRETSGWNEKKETWKVSIYESSIMQPQRYPSFSARISSIVRNSYILIPVIRGLVAAQGRENKQNTQTTGPTMPRPDNGRATTFCFAACIACVPKVSDKTNTCTHYLVTVMVAILPTSFPLQLESQKMLEENELQYESKYKYI